MLNNMRPMSNRVLVEIKREQKKTESGLYIPDSATVEYPTNNATVLAIGPEVKEVSLYDVIVIHKHSGTEVGDDLLIVREDEILGVIAS